MLEYVTIDVICITWIYKCSIFVIKRDSRSDFDQFSQVSGRTVKTCHTGQQNCGFVLWLLSTFLEPAHSGCVEFHGNVHYHNIFGGRFCLKKAHKIKKQCWIYNFITLYVGFNVFPFFNLVALLLQIAWIIIVVVMIIILTFLFSIFLQLFRQKCIFYLPCNKTILNYSVEPFHFWKRPPQDCARPRVRWQPSCCPCVYEFDITWTN